MTKLIYEDLTYRLNGIFFKVHNEIGRFASEKQYGDAVEKFLKNNSIEFKREVVLDPVFEGERPGRNKADFIIEDKIVLELKAKRIITKEDYFQAQRYLRSLNLKVAILINFHQQYLRPKRIINSSA